MTDLKISYTCSGDPGFFQRGLGGNSYTIYINYIYTLQLFTLLLKVHVSTYCTWSYSLHAAVPAVTMQTNVTIRLHDHFSLAWPDPFSCRGRISCSISAYITSDNVPMQTRVWHSKTRSFMSSELPHGHFIPIASVLLLKSFNISVRQFITWVPIVDLLTMRHVSISLNHWIHFLLQHVIMCTTEQCSSWWAILPYSFN